MSQISPPLRILLVGSIVFLAAWFAFLRPGGGTGTTAPATPSAPAATDTTAGNTSSAPGAAVDAATSAASAAATADAASAGETAATTATATPAATTTAPKAGATPSAAEVAAAAELKAADLPAPVAKALAADKVLVLCFFNPKAADDRAVRAAVKGVGRHHGDVVVHVANVKDIARYAPITRGVDVQQSPSVVVVDRKLQGELLTGYVDRVTIQQAVSDALRAG
jgi:cytoskeletal protein RodZ